MTTKIPIKETKRDVVAEAIMLEVTIEINQKSVDISIESDFDTFNCQDETEYTIESKDTLTKEEEVAIDKWVMKREWNK